MADITKFLFLRHLRSNPTAHIRHLRRGKVAHDGAAQAFWFRPLTAAISEIPIDDREQSLLFHARTTDFQQAIVQATITYRIADPAVASTRLDFGIDPRTGQWHATPLEQLGALLTELAQQHGMEVIAAIPLPTALASGINTVRTAVANGLRGDERLAAMGVEVVDVRVSSITTEVEVERALQTPSREEIQKEADRATFDRRAVAVERERTIAENELQSQIELAKREETLVEQRGLNERKRSSEQVAAEEIQHEAKAKADRLLADARADALRSVGAAEAETEAAKLAAYGQVQAATLLALAAKELAAHLPAIGTLNITPDLITQVMTSLAAAQSAPAAAD